MFSLPTLPTTSPTALTGPARRVAARSKLRAGLLQLYRLAVLVAIVWIMREHYLWLRQQGDHPVTVTEVQQLLPGADRLQIDHSPRQGFFVLNAQGELLGYALRTSPTCDHMIGYCDFTDTLVALDTQGKVSAIAIRRSGDTIAHVGDVKADNYFMTLWNGMTWEEIAGQSPRELEIEGVSGATMTSMNVADTLHHRFRHALEQENAPRPIRFGQRDVALVAVIVVALLFSFTRLKGWKWTRRAFQIAVIGYVGLVNGDLLAQSLLVGYATAGVAWQLAPGVALLAAAALVVPWATRRPVYCAHICPHGAAQELLGRLVPYKLPIPTKVARWLKTLPLLLLAAVLIITMLELPQDLAAIEPFDAYVFRTAGWATIIIALLGLVASLFVPQAYCKYGCPTGALLEIVRAHGAADKFGRRDLFALGLVLLAVGLYWRHDLAVDWIIGRW